MVPVPFYSGLSELAERYDAYLLDSWGVLQDGVTAFEAANKCLRELKNLGKQIVILSNSARRSTVVAQELTDIGVTMSCVDGVITGGEAAWQSLSRRESDADKALGDRCYYLGSQRSRSLLDGLDLTMTTALEDATFILNTAPPDGLSNEKLIELLNLARQCGLPMVCANPDLVAYHGMEMRICAGEIARLYEELGAEVIYHGKPHHLFYRQALECLKPIEAPRILAVGDSFRTDLAGAVNAGIDALFVTSGIHRDMLSDPQTRPERISELCVEKAIRPVGAVANLSW